MTRAEKLNSAQALVVGGGIVGLCCALALQRRGLTTVLFDPAMLPRSASWGNAGHIATEQVEPLASPAALASLPRRLFSRGGGAAFPARDVGAWLPFGLRLLRASQPNHFAAGTRAMKSLLAGALPAWRRLAAAAGSSALLAEDGHYLVWESASGAKSGRQHWSRSDLGTASIHELSREDVALLTRLTGCEPMDGLRFTGTGRVRDPGQMLDALARAFVAAGGEWRRETIVAIEPRGPRARLRLASGETCEPQAIVLAAGLASAGLIRPLGHRAPLIAERGYHIQGDIAEDGQAWPDLPPVVFEDRSLIVSRFQSGLRAASFVEFSRAGSPPDARKWQRLRAHARELRLPMLEPLREWMGVRPTLPDYLPAIGRSRRCPNLLYAFGHQHLGLTLAPVTGELVAALATDARPVADLTPFALERFGG
jgi:D-hydroxyproline dehydrogenase